MNETPSRIFCSEFFIYSADFLDLFMPVATEMIPKPIQKPKIVLKFRHFAQNGCCNLSLLMKKVENAIKQGKNEKNLANKSLV